MRSERRKRGEREEKEGVANEFLMKFSPSTHIYIKGLLGCKHPLIGSTPNTQSGFNPLRTNI